MQSKNRVDYINLNAGLPDRPIPGAGHAGQQRKKNQVVVDVEGIEHFEQEKSG